MTRRSGTGKSTATRSDCPIGGFTLVEVVVALFVISAALLILLATVHRGLVLLGEIRDEFRVVIDAEPVSAFLALELPLEEDGEDPWQVEEIFPVSEFRVVRALPGAGKPALALWVSPLEKEEDEAEEPGEIPD